MNATNFALMFLSVLTILAGSVAYLHALSHAAYPLSPEPRDRLPAYAAGGLFLSLLLVACAKLWVQGRREGVAWYEWVAMLTAAVAVAAPGVLRAWSIAQARRDDKRHEAEWHRWGNQLLILLAVFLSGCSRELTYGLTRPDGTREELRYRVDGYETKVGKATVTKRSPDGTEVTATLENLDTQSQGLNLAGRALDVAGAALGKGLVRP